MSARIPSLDGIRAVAILLVVLAHLGGSPGFINWPGDLGSAVGDFGVRTFFVLSGFLISTLLLGEYANTGRIDLYRFYLRRAFRIFPAFYFFLLILTLACAAGLISIKPGDLTKAATYVIDYCRWDSTSNFVSHIWSLSVEEQFYLIWPIAMWAWGPKRGRWIAVASILLSPVWRSIMFHFLPAASATLDRRFDALSDSLATGCLLACLQTKLANTPRYVTMLKSRWAIGLLLAAIVAGLATGDYPSLSLTIGRTMTHIAIALFIHRSILFPPTWLNVSVMRHVGILSYSIYLWQQVFCSPHAGWSRLPVYAAVTLTLAASWLSYRLIETPFLRFGARFSATGSGQMPNELVPAWRVQSRP